MPSQRENFCTTISAFGVEDCYVPSRIVAVIHLESDREPQHFMSLLVKYVHARRYEATSADDYTMYQMSGLALLCPSVTSRVAGEF
jgi:hypothetical protein